jgi:hypothetical protein
MSVVLSILIGCALAPSADTSKSLKLRYVRLVDGELVTESTVTTTRTDKGTTYVSVTERGDTQMTLTLRFNKDNRLTDAEAVLQRDKRKQTALLTLTPKRAMLKRGGTTDVFKVAADPIVTTAPDWSDIFQLVNRYDAKKAGKQEFAGVWFHPTEQTLMPTFTIERVGKNQITVKDKKETLDRYRIQLRSGEYTAWANPSGVVVKLQQKGTVVALEEYEEATRELRP